MTFLIIVLQLLVLLGLIYIIMVHAFVSTQTVWHEVAYLEDGTNCVALAYAAMRAKEIEMEEKTS